MKFEAEFFCWLSLADLRINVVVKLGISVQQQTDWPVIYGECAEKKNNNI